MIITKEYLQSEITNLQSQHDTAVKTAFAAEGAIQALQHLLAKVESDALTMSELGQMLNCKVSDPEPLP